MEFERPRKVRKMQAGDADHPARGRRAAAAESACVNLRVNRRRSESKFQDPRARAGAVEAMSRCISALADVSVDYVVQKGKLLIHENTTLVADEKTVHHCINCNVRVSHALLCGKCKTLHAKLRRGKSISRIWYEGSHPLNAFTDDKMQTALNLKQKQALAIDAMHLAAMLGMHAKQRLAMDQNAFVDIGESRKGGLWVAYRATKPVSDDVHVGGLGSELRERVRKRAEAWIDLLDDRICDRFGLAREETQEETCRLARRKSDLAFMVACRVSGVNPVRENTGEEYEMLTSERLEKISNVEYANSKEVAEQEARRDAHALLSLGTVMSIAFSSEDADLLRRAAQLLQNPQMRKEMARVLLKPVPECMALLDWTTVKSFVVRIAEALSCEQEVGMKWVCEWHELMRCGPGFELVNVVKKAAGNIAVVASPFLKIVRKAKSGKSRKGADGGGRLPPPLWKSAEAMVQWELVEEQRAKTKRFCLDAVGTRIVFLVSVVWELQALKECALFAEGEVGAQMLSDVCDDHFVMAKNAFHTLEDTAKPLSIGYSYEKTRGVLVNSAGTLIETDVRNAIANLSLLSVEDLCALFIENGVHSGKCIKKLREVVVNKMKCKPVNGYSGFVVEMIKPIIIIVHKMRSEIGIGCAGLLGMCTTPFGDLLRTVPAVRNWNVESGNLSLSLRDLKHADKSVKTALDSISQGGGRLVFKRRVGTRMVYTFVAAELKRVLGAVHLGDSSVAFLAQQMGNVELNDV